MLVQDYLNKYSFRLGKFCIDSLMVDMTIDFITKIELLDKFETPYKAFKLALDELNIKYEELKQNGLRDAYWNIFYAKFFSRLRELFYEAEPMGNGTPNYKNVYQNYSDDCDFFLWILDESKELRESKYTFNYSCFLKIYPQVTDDEKVILQEYENLVGDETSYDDRYEYTIAKNQCLYLVNRSDFNVEKARIFLHAKKVVELKSRQPEIVVKKDPLPEDKETALPSPVTIPAQAEASLTFSPDKHVSIIKDMLLNNLVAIQKGEMDVNRANSFNTTVQTYINMAKAQLEIEKFVQSKTLDK